MGYLLTGNLGYNANGSKNTPSIEECLPLHRTSKTRHTTSRHLYDLENFGYRDPDQQWKFYLLEEQDMDRAADLALECFYEPKLKLDTKGMAPKEEKFWNSIVRFMSAWDRTEVRLGNFWGFRSRGGKRLSNPNLQLSSDSMIIGAVPYSRLRLNPTPVTSEDMIGIVEICIEKVDGKLTPCFRYPWSRRNLNQDEPYLCNLCISPLYRRLGLGKKLCQLTEEIIYYEWQKQYMYLHVENKNENAQKLYISLDYKPYQLLSTWELKLNNLENILYYAKNVMKKYESVERNSLSGSGSSSSSSSSSTTTAVDVLKFKISSVNTATTSDSNVFSASMTNQ